MKNLRRVFVVLLVAVLACSAVFAGGTKETTTTTTTTTNKKTTTSVSKEAPMLAEKVAKGQLPALENRIPVKSDVMVESLQYVGTYGGNFQMVGTSAGWGTGKPIEQGLFRFTNNGTVEPNVAKSWESNADYTVWTIHLRQGMKWSDGEPFTAYDCCFFYDHMCVPETFGKSLWECFYTVDAKGNKNKCTFKQIDDVTFTVTFKDPKPLFPEELAINGKWCFAPSHYMKTILPEFIGQDAAEKKAKEMGFSDAKKMGKETGYYFWNVAGIPTLNSYVLSTEPGKNDTNGTYWEFVRNPYYWKVDQEGKQLPYVDSIQWTKISDDSQSLIKILAGEVDFATAGWADIETLSANANKVGYKIYQWATSGWSDVASQVELNQTAPNLSERKLFQAKEFRQALSISVNRTEFAKNISGGWSEPGQAAPAEGAMGYTDAWAQKWCEYDPKAAEALIVKLGCKKGKDGFYDCPDGTDLCIDFLTYTGSGADDSYQLLNEYWKAIGIKSTYKPMDKDTLNNLITGNQYDAVISPVAPAETISLALRPDTLVPVRNYAEWYGDIGTWVATNGASGVAPTGDLAKLCEVYKQFRNSGNPKERESLAMQMYKLHEENIWVLGYVRPSTLLYIVDSRIKNFPATAMFSDEQRGLGIAHIDCCFFGN